MERKRVGNARTARQVVSLQNERVKEIRALDMRKVRRQTGLFVAEGASVLVTAREAGFVPQTLVFHPGRASGRIHKELVAWALEAGCDVLEVSEAVLGKLSSKDNPQSMLGVFSQRFVDLPRRSDLNDETVWLALEEVRDPGNLGTIIRTVDAVGAGGVILVGTCCDAYSREAVRATMGSIFNVAISKVDHDSFSHFVDSWPGSSVGLHLEGYEDFRNATYKMPALVVMGGEGPGLSQGLSARCSKLVKIPMSGALDSLNLSVATSLTLYQVRGPYLSLKSADRDS